MLPRHGQHNHDGLVQHEEVRQHAGPHQVEDAAPGTHASVNRVEASFGLPKQNLADDDLELYNELVRLEAERVQAKFLSVVDTRTEVILRFDFMNNHDTRVRRSLSSVRAIGCNDCRHAPMVLTLVCLQVAMFVVYAATFSGFIISIVQFINVMTKV